MAYKQIHETFWTDPEVKRYKPLQRYLFSYFITCPHAHHSGLYYLPVIYVQNETGLSLKEIEEGIKFLTEKGHIHYDFDREVIFVRSEILYQMDNKRDGKVILNEKHIIGLKKHFDTLHRSPLIANFLEIYAYLNIEYTGIDRGTDTRINTGMDRDSVPVPVTVPFPVTVGKDGTEGDQPTKPQRVKYLDSVYLSDDEHQKLQEAMGQKSLDIGIEKLDYSITVKGQKYKDHYKTLLNWWKRGFLNSNSGGIHGNENARDEIVQQRSGKSNYPVDIKG